MVSRLIPWNINAVLGAAAVGSSILFCSAHAEALIDPTKPPAIPTVSSAGNKEEAGKEHLILQSIFISPNYRSAIINGQTLIVGAAIGESKLTKITETSVTLRNGDGSSEVIMLYPSVDKQISISKNKSANNKSTR